MFRQPVTQPRPRIVRVVPRKVPKYGASAAPILYYNKSGVPTPIPCLYLGLEKKGKYANGYNFIGGKHEPNDGFFPNGDARWDVTVVRETYEETNTQGKHNPVLSAVIDRVNKNQLPTFCKGNSGIFCFRIADGTRRDQFFPSKEMYGVGCFPVGGLVVAARIHKAMNGGMIPTGIYDAMDIQGNIYKVSSYVLSAVLDPRFQTKF